MKCKLFGHKWKPIGAPVDGNYIGVNMGLYYVDAICTRCLKLWSER